MSPDSPGVLALGWSVVQPRVGRRPAWVILLLVGGGLAGCDRQALGPAATAPPAEVTISRPLVQEVTDWMEGTGTTAPLEEVEVRARVTGFLQHVHFEPRARVKPGDVLFTIDPRPFRNALDSATAALAATQAQLVKAQADLEKVQSLIERGAASEDELTSALATRDSLKAQGSANEATIANARLQLDWSSVTAPIHGRISRNLVDPGNLVAADTTVLATIVNDTSIFVYFNATERGVLTLREHVRRQLAAMGAPPDKQPEVREANWPAYVGLMTEEGYPHAGVIDYVAPALDPGTGTQQLRMVIPNEGGLLLAGLFVRVRVPVSKPYAALTVTERALGLDQGQRYLLVVNDQDVVEYRPVTVGTLHAGLRGITAGLSPTDRVIVNGIQRVRPGLKVKPIEAPMPVGPDNARDRPAASAPATSPATPPTAP